MQSLRRLVLVRHATAAPPEAGGRDADRELTDHGLDEARELGRWLGDEGHLPQRVICSPATRTRQTWSAIVEATGHGIMIDMEPSVYEASPEDLLAVLGGLEDSVRSTLVVGHAPGVPALAYDLCDGRGPDADVAALTRSFVPASAAVLTFEGPFAELHRGCADLVRVRTPI